MKSVKTLIPDIYDFMCAPKELPPGTTEAFATSLATILSNRVSPRREDKNNIRLSNVGFPDRKLWYTINQPELAEPLDGKTRLKFLMGDLWEAVLLFLARASGHTVRGEQDEVAIAGVVGHTDGTIDGHPVDVKSASPFSFQKFQKGLTKEEDSFGYLSQLASYSEAQGQKTGSFLAGEKVSGELHLDTHDFSGYDMVKEINRKKAVVAGPMPPRCYPDEKDGESGNRKLNVVCSYCSFRKPCWPGLRAFAHYNGLKVYTVVPRPPKYKDGRPVPEVKL